MAQLLAWIIICFLLLSDSKHIPNLQIKTPLVAYIKQEQYLFNFRVFFMVIHAVRPYCCFISFWFQCSDFGYIHPFCLSLCCPLRNMYHKLPEVCNISRKHKQRWQVLDLPDENLVVKCDCILKPFELPVSSTHSVIFFKWMYMDLLGETIQQQALNIWASQHICKGFHITIDRKNTEIFKIWRNSLHIHPFYL